MADGRELAGRTAVVLGYGAIGARVGRALQGLGLDVIAVTRSGTASRSSGVSGATPHRVVAAAELDAVLPEADVLAITVPATERTRGRIDAAALARLPANAILVNVARGSVVDEAALFEALRTGRLFGAGLDVWYRYPSADEEPGTATLPGRLPFHELESVVLSPHRGGHVDDTERTRMIALARLVELARAGHPLPDRVDLVAGY
jgi:phosphoglycerate dehydrogenase-like enzyme